MKKKTTKTTARPSCTRLAPINVALVMPYLKDKNKKSEKALRKIAINVHACKFIVDVKLCFMVFREVLSITLSWFTAILHSIFTLSSNYSFSNTYDEFYIL
jgi:hypothetical protein